MTPPSDRHRTFPVDQDLPAILARGPASLPVVVPHLVGFVPERSFVVLGLDEGSCRSLVTLRFDLPPTGLSDAELLQMLDTWSTSLETMRRSGAAAATVVVYPCDHDDLWLDVIGDELPFRELAGVLEDMLLAAGYGVPDVVCVVGDRMRSYLCENLDCCPSEGRALDASEMLRIKASLVERGSAPLASRQSLVDSLSPRPDDDPFRREVLTSRDGVVVRLPAGARAQVDRFLRDVDRWGARPTSTRSLIRLVVVVGHLVSQIGPRDYLLRQLAVECGRSTIEAVRWVLIEAVRCSRASDTAPLSAVLAVCAWMVGDGAAARVALDRALAADPAYSLAHLVSAALDNGIPPWSWRESMRGLTAEAILGAGPPGQERSPT